MTEAGVYIVRTLKEHTKRNGVRPPDFIRGGRAVLLLWNVEMACNDNFYYECSESRGSARESVCCVAVT